MVGSGGNVIGEGVVLGGDEGGGFPWGAPGGLGAGEGGLVGCFLGGVLVTGTVVVVVDVEVTGNVKVMGGAEH